MDNTHASDNNAPEQKKGFSAQDIWDVIKFTLIAVLIVVPIRVFIAQPFIVSGESMVPTFQNGDYLIIDEISYRLGEPERGDVIVFRYPQQPERFFIKRIIGLPGERISIENNTVTIYPDLQSEGMVLNEQYLDGILTEGIKEETLDEDEYFVMGDNRPASSDSRAWGPLGEEFIVGRAWARLFPVSEFGLLPGKEDLSSPVATL